MKMKMAIISVGIFAAMTVILVQSEYVRAEGYIDVHVHLRGTTKSGMLGNAGKGPRQGGQMRGGPIRGKRQQQYGQGRGGPYQRGSGKSQAEYLKTAAENLIKKMNRYGVEQALVVVVPGPNSNDAEYSSMRKVVAKYPDRLKLMAGGATLSPYLQGLDPKKVTDAKRSRFKKIAYKVISKGAVGFGEMISYHLSMADHHSFQYAPPDHPLFLTLADISAVKSVPIDLHMEAIVKRRPMPDNLRRISFKNPKTLEPTIPAFERLLKHNPKARIVWQHIGWDNTGDMTAELVERLMSTHSNLYIALRVEKRLHQVGNGPMMPNRLVDYSGRLKEEWRELIYKFSDRITIGTDEFFFPVVSERPNQSFKETWPVLNQIGPDLRRKIGGNNARRIYNLN